MSEQTQTYSITVCGADGGDLEELMHHLNHVLEAYGADVEFTSLDNSAETVWFDIQRPSENVSVTTFTQEGGDA